ncbi:MAG: 50S ribosomal protein L25/general stress protein Ctc, partial [Candidatus Paceibacterota bacterium]
HDVVFDSTKGGAIHVDFYAIERGKELTTHVPLEYEGTAPAEELDGVLNKVLHEVEVTCRPSVLPHSIIVDVGVLAELDSQLKIKDLKVPNGVTIENDPEDLVALISVVEEEEEVPETVDMDAIEVEHKGKEGEEELEEK